MASACDEIVAIAEDQALALGCPRCGYDQRGVVTTWRESCPLTGVCAECGLEFAWDEVLRPDRLTPRWCVEFTPRRRGIPWASLKTWLRSFWPWGFWKRMKMAFAVRWLRIAAYMVMLLLPMLLLYAGGRAGMAAYARWQWQKALDRSQQQLPTLIAKWQARATSPVQSWSMLPSIGFVENIDNQRRRARVLASLQQQINTPPVIDHSYAAAMFEAVFTPLAETSSGSLVNPSFGPDGAYLGPFRQAYPTPPAELVDHISWAAWNPGAGGSGWIGARPVGETMEELAGPAVLWLGVLLLMPLSLALLPVSRKRAKVRWGHIGRVAAYSLFIPITLAYLVIAIGLANLLTPSPKMPADDFLWLVPLLGMPALMACWWWAAIKHYLRLPHALAVTMIMGVLCALLAGSALFWIGTALDG